MPKITIIPAREQRPERLRVAAYCRVSSDSADQKNSYANQIRAYTAFIGQHDGWELVDIYADEGLTGTRMDKREDFQRMMADCRKGRIDRVLCKSVSRFARNARDCLTALRELMSLGVSVSFEEDHIDTETLTTEMMVSVFSALAQQESVSISQNQRMSYRRRMERGEFITCSAPLGYRLVNRRELVIVPEEAKLVRWIFQAYLDGCSSLRIAEILTEKGVPTTEGKVSWNDQSVREVLRNEKYVGDARCQKSYAIGFPYVRKINYGEVDQYYSESTHPPIISHDMFEKVQKLLDQRGETKSKTAMRYPLSMKIYCGCCGSVFSRKCTQRGHIAWACRKHCERITLCPVGRIPETEIYAAFVRMYNKLRLHTGIVLQPAMDQLEALEAAIHRDDPAMLEINRAIAQVSEQNYKITRLLAGGLLDTDVCAAKTAALNGELIKLRAKKRRLQQNNEVEDTTEAVRHTLDLIRQGPERLAAFDEGLFQELVERITAESSTRIRFRLYGGIELTERLQEARR